MLDRITNYLDENEYKLTIYEDKIHILNYTRLISIENNYLSFYIKNKKVIIKGKDFRPRKLLEKELLLDGLIISIEVINE